MLSDKGMTVKKEKEKHRPLTFIKLVMKLTDYYQINDSAVR